MMTDSMRISEATEADAAAWDAYVELARDATFFHRFGWRNVIKRAYGYSSCYVMARRGGRIVGVLPMIDVKSALFGRNLISTAFTVGGGIAADDAEVCEALAEAAVDEGRRRRVKYVEFRSRSAVVEGWEVKNDVYAGFEAAFAADEAANLKEIPRRRRAEVRKGLDALAAGDLRYDFDDGARAFYPLYAQAMRDHGTPIFPQKFVTVLMEEFNGCADILIIRAEEEPVLALLSFHFRDRVMPYYFGARADARAHRAYDLAIWLQMRRGAARGARVFDFGRSKYGAGSFDYKAYWGFEPKPLEYQYKLIGARRAPNVNPDNPKFSAASAAWRRLPLAAANLAGPLLARHLA